MTSVVEPYYAYILLVLYLLILYLLYKGARCCLIGCCGEGYFYYLFEDPDKCAAPKPILSFIACAFQPHVACSAPANGDLP